MRGHQLLKKIERNKINPGTKFRIKHSDGNLDQDIMIRYDLDENGFGALYTVDKVVNKSYICDTSIIINNDFFTLKESKKRDLLFIKSFKNAFIPSVHILTFILSFFYYIFVNLNISLSYIILSFIITVVTYLYTVVLEIIISLKCRKNKFGQFNLDIDKRMKGKKYGEIIDFYKFEVFSFDQLFERKVYLESYNIDRGLTNIKSIAITVVITWIFNYLCQIFSKSSNIKYFQYLIGTLFFIVAMSPIIYKYLKLLKISTDYSTNALELNIINKLIDKMEQQQLSS